MSTEVQEVTHAESAKELADRVRLELALAVRLAQRRWDARRAANRAFDKRLALCNDLRRAEGVELYDDLSADAKARIASMDALRTELNDQWTALDNRCRKLDHKVTADLYGSHYLGRGLLAAHTRWADRIDWPAIAKILATFHLRAEGESLRAQTAALERRAAWAVEIGDRLISDKGVLWRVTHKTEKRCDLVVENALAPEQTGRLPGIRKGGVHLYRVVPPEMVERCLDYNRRWDGASEAAAPIPAPECLQEQERTVSPWLIRPQTVGST